MRQKAKGGGSALEGRAGVEWGVLAVVFPSVHRLDSRTSCLRCALAAAAAAAVAFAAAAAAVAFAIAADDNG